MVQVMKYRPVNAWILPYLRQGLAEHFDMDVWVSDHWPEETTPAPKSWVAVRDDGCTGRHMAAQDRMITITVSGRTQTSTDELCESVAALIRAMPHADHLPVCAVAEPSGGYAVEDKDWPYLKVLSIDITQVGKVISL